MTREEAKKLLPIIEAYANGAIVQFRDAAVPQWADVEDPHFASHARGMEYRIKPKAREWWVANYTTHPKIYKTKCEAVGSNSAMLEIIHVREVLPEDEK